jgi:uncharacterized protein
MEFEWDQNKAKRNLKDHGISFKEAATVLGDSLSTTYPDPDHSIREARFLTIGTSDSGRLLVVSHTERGGESELSVRGTPRAERRDSMRKKVKTEVDDMRPEYDFVALKGGVKGKYAAQYRAGTNLVLLAPDVAQVFSNDEAVNKALRLLMELAKAQASRVS